MLVAHTLSMLGHTRLFGVEKAPTKLTLKLNSNPNIDLNNYKYNTQTSVIIFIVYIFLKKF